MKIKYNGKTYMLVPAPRQDECCAGCAFDGFNAMAQCLEVNRAVPEGCKCTDVLEGERIYVEVP